jgi:murein tripeptide amidase MpaA
MCFALHFAQAQEKEKFSQVKIFVLKKQVANLQEQGLDIDHAYYDPTEQSLSMTLSQKEIQKLKNAGVNFRITVADEQEDFLRRNNPKDFFKYDNSRNDGNALGKLVFNTPDKSFVSTIVTPVAANAGSMGGYLTFADMKKELDSMVLNYPTLVKLDSIGRTHENRAIWALTISDNASVNENETEVLYTGMHHAREPLAMQNLIFFMQYLLENYASNARIKDIVDSRKLVFIPCMNPDGYVYNQSTNPSGGGLWRKNRQPNSDGSFGQDLNRNYGYGFDYPNSGSSDVSTDANYHGDFAFQAMETQLMREYLRAHNFHIAINYHSYGGYWIHGNTVPTYSLSSTDSAAIKTTGAVATHNSFYEVGTPFETVGYNGNGTVEDWCLAGDAGIRPPVYSISPEVGLGLTTFWPTSDKIIGYCKETLFGNLQAALFGGAYIEASDKTNLSVASKTGNIDVLVRRIGLVDSAVKVTIIPLRNMLSVGSPVTISSIPTYGGTATATISYTLHPALTNGQQFRYIVKTETSGITTLDTVVKFLNATIPLQDNMESGAVTSKWIVGSGWNYSTRSAFSGSQALSQSTTGSYTDGQNLTINAATNLNLTGATAAYLTFWTRYKSEPGNDKLQVKVSTNGSTYTALPGVHTVSENKGTLGGVPSLTGYQDHWVREVVDLKSVLNYGAVRLRFEFTSNGSVTGEGFYIDDLEVVTSTAALVTLPIHFLDVKAVRTGREISIRWESEIDSSHLYFEVERATDGKTFSHIYKTTDKQRVLFAADNNPVPGLNYYRIKAVGRNGIQYSKIVTVTMSQRMAISLYPNPVAQQLHLELNGVTAGRYQVQILTQTGQVASHRELNLTGSESEVLLSVNGLSAGSYQLCLRDGKGELVEVKSFVKQ